LTGINATPPQIDQCNGTAEVRLLPFSLANSLDLSQLQILAANL
jgi:hypothetical protein